MTRRRARRTLEVFAVVALAACEPVMVSEHTPYGDRWWEATTPAVEPTATVTVAPTGMPTVASTVAPTAPPTVVPTIAPTVAPTMAPTAASTGAATPPPSEAPTATPTAGFRCEPAVLDTEPSEAFDLIGIIEVQSRRPTQSSTSALASAKLQACALGGDALVILYRNERQGGTPPVITGPSAMLPSPEIRAAVIRYRSR